MATWSRFAIVELTILWKTTQSVDSQIMQNKVCASILLILVYVAQTWWPDSLSKDKKGKNIKNRDGKNCGKFGKFQNCELETIFLVDKTTLVEIL